MGSVATASPIAFWCSSACPDEIDNTHAKTLRLMTTDKRNVCLTIALIDTVLFSTYGYETRRILEVR